MSSDSSMFNSPQVDSMWQEFCRSADYRQALQWGASDEVPGALFVAFRAGLWAAISAAPAAEPAGVQGVHQTEQRLDADGAADAKRLDWLGRMANAKGGLLLHDGSEGGRAGLGLRPGSSVRTLREAIDQAMNTHASIAAMQEKP